MKHHFLAALALGATHLSISAPQAAAHSWYPKACCSDQDCEAIPSSAVSEVQGGFRISYVSPRFGAINEFVNGATVKLSEDGGFHGCWRKSNVQPRSICFFAPFNV
jgi:hypothetical protein